MWPVRKGALPKLRVLVEQRLEWPAVRRDFHRFLSRTRGASIEQQSGTYQALLWRKISRLLHLYFERVDGGTVQRFRSLSAVASSSSISLSDIAPTLPPLESVLVSPRKDRAAELVRNKDLRAQIERIFSMVGNRPLTCNELQCVVWDTLHPKPDSLQRHALPDDNDLGELPGALGNEEEVDFASLGGNPLFQLELIESAARLEVLAHQLLSSLPERVKRSAAARWTTSEERFKTLEEVAKMLGVSRGTVDNDVHLFLEQIHKVCQTGQVDGEPVLFDSGELDNSERYYFVHRVLENLRASPFSIRQEP